MNNIFLLASIVVVAGVTLLRPRLGLYLMMFLTPIQYYLVLASGGTLIKYIGWVVVFAWIVQKVLTRSPIGPWQPAPLLIPILLFWYLCLISFAWSFDTNWQISIFSYTQLIVWVALILDVIDTQKRLEWMLLSLVLGVLISASILFYEFLTNARTWEYSTIAEGGFGDRNTTAASFLYVMPILFYWLQQKGGVYRLLVASSVVLLLIGVGISVSRTSLLMLPVLFILQIRMAPSARKVSYLFLLGVLITISLPFWPWEHIDYRFAEIWTGGNPGDLGGRVRTTKLALEEFQQSPLLGRGLGSYKFQYTTAAHNLFLEIASQLGILGLLTITLIWITVWRHLAKAHRRAQAIEYGQLAELIRAVQLSAVVFFLFSLSVSTETHRLLWFTFALSGICHNIAYSPLSAATHFSKHKVAVPPKSARVSHTFN